MKKLGLSLFFALVVVFNVNAEECILAGNEYVMNGVYADSNFVEIHESKDTLFMTADSMLWHQYSGDCPSLIQKTRGAYTISGDTLALLQLEKNSVTQCGSNLAGWESVENNTKILIRNCNSTSFEMKSFDVDSKWAKFEIVN